MNYILELLLLSHTTIAGNCVNIEIKYSELYKTVVIHSNLVEGVWISCCQRCENAEKAAMFFFQKKDGWTFIPKNNDKKPLLKNKKCYNNYKISLLLKKKY